MLVRGGSPENGTASGRCGPTDDQILSRMFFLPPSCSGVMGRMLSSALCVGLLGLAATGPRTASSSGRNGRACSLA